jgi:predicted amidohydrolase YtcJ
MKKHVCYLLTLLLTLSLWSCNQESSEDDGIDLVLTNGKIWTGDESNPWASWVAVKGEKITQIGTDNQSPPAAAQTIDLEGQLTLPGFNDSHVHFASAGSLLLGINLLDVNDEQKFRQRVQETTQRLPKGSWITRGDWGAYEAWGMGSEGSQSKDMVFTPSPQDDR